MVCSTAGMRVISCRGSVRLRVMPLQQQKGRDKGDGGVHGSWEGQLDCETGKNGKMAATAENWQATNRK